MGQEVEDLLVLFLSFDDRYIFLKLLCCLGKLWNEVRSVMFLCETSGELENMRLMRLC